MCVICNKGQNIITGAFYCSVAERDSAGYSAIICHRRCFSVLWK